jgi:hypothetical protein
MVLNAVQVNVKSRNLTIVTGDKAQFGRTVWKNKY